MASKSDAPFWKGGLLAFLAALTFGAGTPVVQRCGRGVGPFTTAALLFFGSALSSLGGRTEKQAPLRASHAPRLLGVAAFGAVLAPAALSWGLQHAGGTAASLLLNLEAVFTVLLARAFFHEQISARAGVSLALMTGGGAWLVLDGTTDVSGSRWGLVAVAAATLFWAADNTVLRPLADLDTSRVVRWKSGLGAGASLCIALLRREATPSAQTIGELVLCGIFGYGLSLRLYLHAQRRIGAGRTGSIFAAAPFAGALVALALGDRTATSAALFVALLFAAGIYLQITEKHEHAHTHEPTEHEHAHTHDDGHHDHAHDPPVIGEHSHVHRHEALVHEHPHAPDIHHQHPHG
ncbi:MAG: DMT family transporter [Polyangiaceae bacterium]